MEVMTDEEFQLLRDFISQKSGISYGKGQKFILQQKLYRLLEKTSFKNFKEYYYFLKYSSSKEILQELFDTLAVNETYFFREKEQIFLLKDYIYPELLDLRPNRVIKILSVGCSTGEEPYSISMISSEYFKEQNLNFSITALDISSKALAIAESATYKKVSLAFRSIEPKYLKEHFEEIGQSYKVKDNIRANVKFKMFNLMELQPYFIFGKFDIVYCRNVMIYFDKLLRQQIINYFYENVVNPDGYLILSSTENLNDIETKFVLTRIGQTFVYQKK